MDHGCEFGGCWISWFDWGGLQRLPFRAMQPAQPHLQPTHVGSGMLRQPPRQQPAVPCSNSGETALKLFLLLPFYNLPPDLVRLLRYLH